MLRRLATLGVLLLSLSGVIPTALACALVGEVADCCPENQPCNTETAPVILAADRASCCQVQPAPQRIIIAVRAQTDRQLSDVPAPDLSLMPIAAAAAAKAPPTGWATLSAAADSRPDRQLTYLRTGRLRL